MPRSDGVEASEPAEARADLLARFAPAIFLVLWASGFGVAKLGLEHAGPLTFLALRFGIIVALFVPAFLLVRPKKPESAGAWLHLAVVGFLIQSVYFGLAYAGMSLGVSAGVAAVIASTQPLLVGVAAPFVTAERVGRVKWIGLLVGAAGAVAVIAGAQGEFDASLDLGLLFCVGSAIGMAAATLYQKRFPVAVHPITTNLVHYAVGLVTVGPMALLFEDGGIDWTAELVLSLGWLVVANSILAVSLLLFMIGRSEASRVSALFFLVPPVAALFGWLLLGEALTALAWVGMLLTVVGVGIVARS